MPIQIVIKHELCFIFIRAIFITESSGLLKYTFTDKYVLWPLQIWFYHVHLLKHLQVIVKTIFRFIYLCIIIWDIVSRCIMLWTKCEFIKPIHWIQFSHPLYTPLRFSDLKITEDISYQKRDFVTNLDVQHINIVIRRRWSWRFTHFDMVELGSDFCLATGCA